MPCFIRIDEKENTAAEPFQPNGAVSFLADFAEMFIAALAVIFLIFTFCARLCTVDGSSMNETLKDREMVITENVAYEPKQGDIVTFHLTGEGEGEMNKILIKRVIATEGQTVKINFKTKEITVDGVAYEDEHATFKNPFTGQATNGYSLMPNYNYDPATGEFSVTVGDGEIFVMGDNRNNSHDSRSADIGCVSVKRVLGKVVLRIAPFTVY